MSQTDRRIAIYVLVLAALALGVALGSERFLGMAPCELCLWERWPYRLLLVLAAVALLAPPGLRRILLWVCVFAFLCGAAIAFVHVGVEQGWWPSPLPECSASNLLSGNIQTLVASLPAAPAKPCDAPNFLIPGLPVSFATMDFILAAVGAAALGAYLARSRAG